MVEYSFFSSASFSPALLEYVSLVGGDGGLHVYVAIFKALYWQNGTRTTTTNMDRNFPALLLCNVSI